MKDRAIPPIVTISQVKDYPDQKVLLRGWMFTKRSSKGIHFLQMRDGTGRIQAVAEEATLTPEEMALCDSLSQESALELEGTVSEHPKIKGLYELHLTKVTPIALAEPDFPITPKEHGTDFLMEHRHLWLRSPRQIAILIVRAQVERAIMDYLDGNGFTRVDAPILTPAAAEGTTTLFETDYFGEKAYLSQTGQLYMEAAAMAMGKVYCFGPTFRAEKSKTRRHVTEFWMVEPEVAFFTLDENMALQEDLICFLLERVLDKCQDELKTIERDTKPLEAIHKPFPRLHYRDAAQMLADAGFTDFVCGSDLGAEHETYLSTHPCFAGQPLFLHHFPAECKAFYMQPDPAEPEYSESVDLLAPEGVGEIIGGSMRIHDLALLEQRIREHNLPPEPLQWYLDLRRYGSVPHGGFGLGITRTVSWICGLRHIREALPFPRTMTRIYP
jgi:asparaginyl-tRNA synthetase